MGLTDWDGPVTVHQLADGVMLIRRAEPPAPKPEDQDATAEPDAGADDDD